MYINTGDNIQGTQVWRAFFRSADGVITEFDAPGAGTGPGQGTDLCTNDCLNAAGATPGASIDATNVYHGFIRSKDGDFTLFDPPGSANTQESGMSAGGDVSGFYTDSDGVNHGYIRDKQGHFTDINVPGAGTGTGQGTVVDSIAGGGITEGYYVDANNVYRPASRELSTARSRRSMFQEPGTAPDRARLESPTMRRDWWLDSTSTATTCNTVSCGFRAMTVIANKNSWPDQPCNDARTR